MKQIRIVMTIAGLLVLALAFGFVFRVPLALVIWPWDDGPYSFLFVGSILAAISASLLWISWTGEFGALAGGALNVFFIALSTSIYFFYLVSKGRTGMTVYGLLAAIFAVSSLIAFWWSQRISLTDSDPMPVPVKISFWIFSVVLLLSSSALILRTPIFPWTLNPDTSILIGCIFLGDAFYFLYGLLRPVWLNAAGQLLSFLAYDLVLIVPFVKLFDTVKPEHMLSLMIYVAVLLYSGGLASYYLFFHPQTRLRFR